jgi:hypothetical protein
MATATGIINSKHKTIASNNNSRGINKPKRSNIYIIITDMFEIKNSTLLQYFESFHRGKSSIDITHIHIMMHLDDTLRKKPFHVQTVSVARSIRLIS